MYIATSKENKQTYQLTYHPINVRVCIEVIMEGQIYPLLFLSFFFFAGRLEVFSQGLRFSLRGKRRSVGGEPGAEACRAEAAEAGFKGKPKANTEALLGSNSYFEINPDTKAHLVVLTFKNNRGFIRRLLRTILGGACLNSPGNRERPKPKT